MEISMIDRNSLPTWQYNEFTHPGEDFEIEAELYDERFRNIRNRVGDVKTILGLLNLQPDQTLLEIGAGTGEFAVAAAEHCSKVLAVDLSQSMLRLAEMKAAAKGLKNIEFIQGGFLTYEHNREQVDVVVSQLSLHYLPDFWKQIALVRISNMMKPESKLLLFDSVYSFHMESYQNFFNGFISTVSGMAGKDAVDNMVNHIKEEYSTIDWIMEGLIRRAGFRIEKIEYQVGMFATYLCTKIAQ